MFPCAQICQIKRAFQENNINKILGRKNVKGAHKQT